MKDYKVDYTVWFERSGRNEYTEGSYNVAGKNANDAENFVRSMLKEDYPNSTYIAVTAKEL